MTDLEQRVARVLIKAHKEIWPGSWYAMPEALQLAKAALKAHEQWLAEQGPDIREMLDRFFHNCPIANGTLEPNEIGMEWFHKLSDWTYRDGKP